MQLIYYLLLLYDVDRDSLKLALKKTKRVKTILLTMFQITLLQIHQLLVCLEFSLKKIF